MFVVLVERLEGGVDAKVRSNLPVVRVSSANTVWHDFRTSMPSGSCLPSFQWAWGPKSTSRHSCHEGAHDALGEFVFQPCDFVFRPARRQGFLKQGKCLLLGGGAAQFGQKGAEDLFFTENNTLVNCAGRRCSCHRPHGTAVARRVFRPRSSRRWRTAGPLGFGQTGCRLPTLLG